MRVLALHPDVLVATSAIWQTNCVIVRGEGELGKGIGDPGGGEGQSRSGVADLGGGEGDLGGGVADLRGGEGEPRGGVGDLRGGEGELAAETFVIDSPVLPEELDALPALVEQAGFPAPSGLLATHGDWDHLLGRLAFGDLALGCAQSSAARMHASPGEAQRELRAFDEQHFIERPRPLALGAVQALPVPGRCGIGGRELELHPAQGHTGDGMAVLIGWAEVLVAGDYLSPVELPLLGDGGTAGAYEQTLLCLRPLVQRARHVVPGHGRVLERDQALAILDADLADVREGGPSGATRLRRSSRSGRARG